MPNIKSAEKRVRVSEKKNLRNRMVKSGVKTALKKYSVALKNSLEQAPAALIAASSAVDKAVSKGIIHKNTANRKKARMAKALAKSNA